MQPTEPVKRPTVTLGDKEYPIKFRISDLSKLNKDHGIDLFVKSELVGIAAVERVAIVLAAGIAHTGEDVTSEHIMECIELSELPIYALAIVEAQKKASPAAKAASEALDKMVPKKLAKTPDSTVQ